MKRNLPWPVCLGVSRAFMKDSDDPWLSDIPPTLNALIYFLTRENNGVKVYLKKESVDATSKACYEMSNGVTYIVDANGKWTTIP